MNMANLASSQIGKLLHHSGPLWLRDLHLSGADLAGQLWANLREADRVDPELAGDHQTGHNMNSCQVRVCSVTEHHLTTEKRQDD
jgi:hypothetical protein